MFKKVVWTITILWMLMIFALSHQPGMVSRQLSGDFLVAFDKVEKGEELNIETNYKVNRYQFYLRKLAHMTVYAGLSFLVGLSIFLWKNNRPFNYLQSIIFSFLFALSDEFHQTFIPGRGAMLLDIIIDSVGILVGVLGLVVILEVFLRLVVKKKHDKIT